MYTTYVETELQIAERVAKGFLVREQVVIYWSLLSQILQLGPVAAQQ